MSTKVKFHLISALLNLLVILGAAYINQFIAELYDPAIFAKRGDDFQFIWLCYVFIFFWLYSFTIYRFKNYKKHFYIFLTLGVLLVLFRIIYYYFNTALSIGFSPSDLWIYLQNGFVETLSFIIVVAVGIHFSQQIIGKLILVKYYV